MADKVTTSLAEAKILVMKGQAGYSPQIEVTDIEGGHQIRITTKISDTQYRADVFNVMDGEQGEPGSPGAPGTPGAPGVSPTVSVQDITESLPGGGTKIIGHMVTITDAAGDHTFNVMNGEDGEGGGGSTEAVLYIAQALTDAQKTQARTNIGAGTYSKPSGGIPKTDLASDVQTSLGKADTALQQHQSLSGYATETYVQQQIAAIPDELPAVTAADNGKFFRVVNGAWAAQAVPFQTPRVAMTASDTTPSLSPNKLYVFPEMASLTPTLATPSDATILNEYHFVFDSGATATVLTLPTSVLQPDGFSVEANMHYEISILEGAMTAQGWAVTA